MYYVMCEILLFSNKGAIQDTINVPSFIMFIRVVTRNVIYLQSQIPQAVVAAVVKTC